MEHTFFHYLSPKDIKYTLNGQNLFELRRASLRTMIAKPLGLDMSGTKNDLLGRIIRALDGLESPTEITELAKMSAEPDSPTDPSAEPTIDSTVDTNERDGV